MAGRNKNKKNKPELSEDQKQELREASALKVLYSASTRQRTGSGQ